jgi:hypothetical protein
VSLSGADLALVIAAAVTTAAWLLAVGAVRAYRQPREPPDLEPSLDVGPEPPALAAFLAGNFRVPRDAVPATLLDLCARAGSRRWSAWTSISTSAACTKRPPTA